MSSQISFPALFNTRRLTLRPPMESDAELLCAAVVASYPELNRWLPWAGAPYTKDSALSFCQEAQENILQNKEFAALIVLTETSEIIGSAGLTVTDPEVPSFEIGYWIKTSHAGQGYITEAAHTLAAFALDELQAKRVSLHIDERNAKSIRVVNRLGFKLEAKLKAYARDNAGNLTNFLVFSVFDRSELVELDR